MTELEQFIARHGQPVRVDGPDANGVTTYHAASGDYVAIGADGNPRMRGFTPPAEGAAPTETAPVQPAATPPAADPNIGKMTQQQIEALLARVAPNSDPSRLEPIYGTRNRTTKVAGEIGGEEKSVSAPVRTITWVDRGTGYTVEADIEDDGTYTVVHNGIKTANQGKPATSATAAGTGPKEGDTRGGTANNPNREEFEGGKWVVKPNPLYVPPKPEKPAAPGAITLKPDGKGGTLAIRALPNGEVEVKPLAGVPSDKPKPNTITVEGVVYVQSEDGTSYSPAKGIPLPGATAKNIEPFNPDPAAGPDLGLGAWAAAQRAKIGSPSEAGGITQSEYDAATKAAHDQATVYIQNVTSNQTVRRQQEQDERTQRNELSNQAAADYGKAQSVFTAILGGTKPGSRAIMDVIPGIMAEQARFRGEREGTARPATPLHPMFQNMPAAAGVTTAATPPAAPATPAPPNAIGLGNVGNQPAPTLAPAAAPVQAAVPATPPPPVVTGQQAAAMHAAGINPATGEPTGITTPPPVVTAGQAATMHSAGVNPATGEPNGLPQSPAVAGAATAPVPQTGSLLKPGAQPFTPDPNEGTPGGTVLPQQPNQMPVDVPYPDNAGAMSKAMPGPVSAWASQIAQPQAPASPTAQIGLVPGLQQQAQAARPLFDPMPSAGRLAQLGIPADAIAQALQELGLTPA